MSDPVDFAYVEEAGPGIPELPSDVQFGGAAAPEPLVPEYPGWEEKTVEQFLLGAGSGLHLMVGQGENDWLMTQKDLERIAPPLTRMLNRYEPTLRLSPYADPLLVAHGFALYGWRSALERARALRDRAEQEAEAQPRAGYDRPGGGELEQQPATYFPTTGGADGPDGHDSDE